MIKVTPFEEGRRANRTARCVFCDLHTDYRTAQGTIAVCNFCAGLFSRGEIPTAGQMGSREHMRVIRGRVYAERHRDRLLGQPRMRRRANRLAWGIALARAFEGFEHPDRSSSVGTWADENWETFLDPAREALRRVRRRKRG
jgi:hypothetical protein